jgi:hypothetical protein
VLLPDPDRLWSIWCRERHLVRVGHLGLEPDGPGGRVDHVDHLGQQIGGVLVAGLVLRAPPPGLAWQGCVLVARFAGLEPVLDGLGEFGLPGVVGDMPTDPGGQRLVLGPDRLDKPLAQGLRTGCRVEDQADRAASISWPTAPGSTSTQMR